MFGAHKLSRKLGIGAFALAILALPGCSLWDPYLKPDKATLIDPPNEQNATPNKPNATPNGQNDTPKKPNLDKAIKYAESLRGKYLGALSDQALMGSVLGTVLIPLAASAAYIGITSESGLSKDVILGMALGSSAAVGTAGFLGSTTRQYVYVQGARALDCAIKIVRPLNANLTMLKPKLETLNNSLGVLRTAIGVAEAPGVTVADNILTEAKLVLASGENVLENGNLAYRTVTNAPGILIDTVHDIETTVDQAVIATQPNLQILQQQFGGLVPIWGQVPQMPDIARKELSETKSNDLKASLVAEAPSESDKASANLELQAAAVTTASDAVLNFVNQEVGTPPTAAQLKTCVGLIAKAVQPLVVDTQFIVAKATIAQDSKITARGAKPPYKASFVGATLPPKDSIKVTVNHNDVDSEARVRSGEILLEFTTDTARGEYKLRVSDSSTAEEGGPKTADIQIIVEKNGAAEEDEEEEKFFLKKEGEEPKEINSALGPDKIKKIQIKVGLPADETQPPPVFGYADGKFGPKTYAAIIVYLKAQNKPFTLKNNTVPQTLVEELLK